MTTDSGWENELTSPGVDNVFTDIALLGGGHEHGYCDVYRALRHGKWHVLKSLKAEYRDTPACQAMLRKEFDIGYHLSHPGIAATLGLERVEPLGECIVEEWVDGITLDKFIAGGGLTVAMARDLIVQLCDVLRYIHARQVVHRDLKPSNILVTGDGNRVKVIDFGVSDTADYAILKGPAGTRAYAAPELLAGEPADSRADLYSLGVLIDLMNRGLPHPDRRMSRVARWCSAADRERRPAGAGEVVAALQAPSSMLRYYLAGAVLAVAVVAAIVWWLMPARLSESSAPEPTVVATQDLPETDTIVHPAEHREGVPTALPSQQEDVKAASASAPPASAPPQQTDEAKEPREPKLPPTLRQWFLSRAAQVGYNEARDSRYDLEEVYRMQGKKAFDRHITEFLRERIELEVIDAANNMFPASDERFKPLREYMITPAGRQLIDAGRQEALERAQIILHESFPDLDIPPFPAAAPDWQE